MLTVSVGAHGTKMIKLQNRLSSLVQTHEHREFHEYALFVNFFRGWSSDTCHHASA